MNLPIQNRDKKIRILWLSDIHYLSEKPIYIENLITSFISTVKKIDSEKKKKISYKIDYVIISGDLTNKGLIEEFEMLTKDLITPLFNEIPKAKFLPLVGNHDLEIGKNIDAKAILNLNSINKHSYFSKDKKYNNLYKNYIDFCKKNINLIPNDIEIPYKDHFKYGYHVDTNKSVLFILINSAWYSLSVKLIEFFISENYISVIKEIKMSLERKDFSLLESLKIINKFLTHIKKNLTNDAYAISYKTVEYGNQILLLNLLLKDVKELNKFIQLYPEYFKIAVMHHPENHLEWGERFDENSMYNLLKSKVDLFLTSHEHVRKNHKHTKVKGEALQLKSGAFIELKLDMELKKDIHVEDNLKYSTFSILDVNIIKKNIRETKYTFSKDNWKKHSKKFEHEFLKNKIIFNKMIYSKTMEGIRKMSDLDVLGGIYSIDNLSLISNGIYINANNDLYILVKTSEVDVDTDILYKSILKTHTNNVYFTYLDVLIEKDVNHIDDHADRDIILGQLKTSLFKKFNNFRANFFDSSGIINVDSINQVSFIFILVPYWEINNFFMNNC